MVRSNPREGPVVELVPAAGASRRFQTYPLKPLPIIGLTSPRIKIFFTAVDALVGLPTLCAGGAELRKLCEQSNTTVRNNQAHNREMVGAIV